MMTKQESWSSVLLQAMPRKSERNKEPRKKKGEAKQWLNKETSEVGT